MASAAFDLTTAALGLPKYLAYGTVPVAGNRVFLQELADHSRIVMQMLGAGPWDSLTKLFVNRVEKTGADLTNYFSMFQGLDGEIGTGMAASSSGIAPADQHVSIFWSNTIGSMDYTTFSRKAYLIGRVLPDPTAPGPDLEILGYYKTMKCRIFDNTGTQTSFAWTNNPAWWICDYHIRTFILREGKINQPLVALQRARIDWASVKDAADYFDADIGGGIKRFSDGGVWFTDQGLSASSVFEKMLLMCRSFLLERSGKLYLYADAPRSSVFTFGSDHVLPGSLSVSKANMRAARNRFVASWRETALADGSSDEATRFAPASKNLDNEAHQRAIGTQGPGMAPMPKVLTEHLDYGANTGERVTRLGNFQRIDQLGEDIDSNGTYLAPTEVSLVAYDNSQSFRDLVPGNRVTLHSSLSEEYSGLSFQILKMRVRADGSRLFAGREYNANAYTDSSVVQQSTQAPIPGTGMPFPFVIDPSDELAVDMATRIVGKPVELVRNPNFESGDRDWVHFGAHTGFTIVADGNAYAGTYAAKYVGNTGSYFTNEITIPVKEGQSLYASCMVKRTSGTGEGSVTIVWYDSGMNFVNESRGNAVTSSIYSKSEVIGTAPAGTAFAKVVAHHATATSDTFYFDQFDCQRSILKNSAIYDGRMKPLHISQQAMSRRIGSQTWASGVANNEGAGWHAIATVIVDVKVGVNSIRLALAAINNGDSGSNPDVTSEPTGNLGFSIASGSPGSPQVSRSGDGFATLSSPTIGNGLTLTVYAEYQTIAPDSIASITVVAESDVYQLMQEDGLT